MSELSKIDINNVNYGFKDTVARDFYQTLSGVIEQEQATRIATCVVSGNYNSQDKTIELINANDEVVGTIDATLFVKDGMVSDVRVVNGNLVITFNTDSGKSPISIPLTSIFNPSNYYQKSEIDSEFAEKQSEISNLESKIGYYECSSESSSASKTIAAPNYVLRNGGSMKVKMTNANTSNNVTLNINSTGAKALYYAGVRASAANSWEAGETVEVYYDGTNFYANNVAGGSYSVDGVFDVSAKYPTSGVDGGNTYTLEGALAVLNTNLPVSKKEGGMSIKFVQSSENKYVQYRLTSDSFNTTPSNWQKQGAEVVVTQNTSTGHTDIAIGEVITPVASVEDVNKRFSASLPNVGLIRNDGTIVTGYTNWRYSNYVAVVEGQKFTSFARLSDGSLLMAYYDSDKNFLSSSPLASSPSSTMDFYSVTIPTGVTYIRAVSAYNASNDATLPYLLYDYMNVPDIVNSLTVPCSVMSFPYQGYIKTDGSFRATSASWSATDYISILSGIPYKAYLSAYGATAIAFYDKDKVFLAEKSIFPSENIFEQFDGTIPTDAAYMRCCSHEYPVSDSYLNIYGANSFSTSEKATQKYHNNLQKPYSFTNKKITFFGDSITRGVASDNGELKTLTTNCYAKLLADKLGVSDYENNAVSGSRFSGSNGQIASITSVVTGYSETTDIIYIAGGTNDYQLQSPIGQMGDTTEATLYGALYLCCEFLKTNYPNATILFATPINWSRIVADHNIIIEKYRDAIFEMAAKYGYSVVDGSEIGFPMEQTEAGTPAYKAAIIYDGVHPTVLGHSMLANNIASILL